MNKMTYLCFHQMFEHKNTLVPLVKQRAITDDCCCVLFILQGSNSFSLALEKANNNILKLNHRMAY